ncbi:MAG: chorismate-binding protein [Deltaproteobacteria bacterium]|nr:chorismate-binding protein [Deltaproteobacteria bacterium]
MVPACAQRPCSGVVFGSRTHAVELPGDLLTPFGVFCLLDSFSPGGDAFLFEGALGRYSYVGAGMGPSERLTFGGSPGPGDKPPLETLRHALSVLQTEPRPDLPPLCGGLVGYLGWPAARWSEKLPQRLGPDPLFPDADLIVARELVAFDHRQGRAWAIGLGPDEADAKARAQRLADRVLSVLSGAQGWPLPLRMPAAHALPQQAMLAGSRFVPAPMGGGRAVFEKNVKRALDYIRAGDLFQVVLSQRFELPDCDGFSLYRTLRAASPAPFHFYLRLGGRELFGASPELLVEVMNGRVTVRPIAGTRRRGKTPEEDRALEEELLADPKERAEHVMLVDLGRNDVGRVSAIGSVRLERLMEIERYSHVIHLTSQVSGALKPGLTAVDAFAAAFPAGTLSGAPKIRACEVIDELEPVARGPYGGAVGWFSAAGEMQLAIAIRTLYRSQGRLFAHAGAGIVADSNPAFEWREVETKARAAVSAALGASKAQDESVPFVEREGALR